MRLGEEVLRADVGAGQEEIRPRGSSVLAINNQGTLDHFHSDPPTETRLIEVYLCNIASIGLNS